MQLSYEEALAELQEIVSAIESDTIGMDELSQKVKRAAELMTYCKKKLHQTKEEIGNLFDN